jgi:hypothetical protein
MVERYGAIAEKATQVRLLLRDHPDLSRREIARRLHTSHSWVSRIARELEDEEPYEEPSEPRWRPDLTAFERLEEEVADLRRMNAQLLSDSAALVAENRRLRGE